MKIYVMTDLEGVAGVLNNRDWCERDSRYYETVKDLLTGEVNAAIEGFFAGGASVVIVADGHSWGGINAQALDPRVEYINGFPGPYPFLLDKSWDGIAWIGQYPRPGSEYAHLPHTGNFHRLERRVNDLVVGEFGEMVLCASELGVRSIFLSGDADACREAEALVPGIETVSVIRGSMRLTPRRLYNPAPIRLKQNRNWIERTE